MTPFEVEEKQSISALNRDVVERVAGAVQELGSAVGKPLLLLTAPRAGYGKTHLLGRVAAAAADQGVAMPLAFRSDSDVGWPTVSMEALDILRRQPAQIAGWSRLQEICSGIFSSLVIRLIRSGRLPCANQDQAIRVLSGSPGELFREGSQARLIGDWLRKHYGQLRKPMAEIARQVPGASNADIWVDALFACAHHGTATSVDSVVQMASGSREAFFLWLRMVTLWRPAVLFVDHLDGFYRQEQAGLRIATMLLDLAELESVHVVLSLNQDVWQATFAHHLPSAVEDRLTSAQFLLRGLSAGDALDLVRLRLGGVELPVDEASQFERFLNIPRYFQGRPVGSVSARSFLRHAAIQWEAFENLRGGDEMSPLIRGADEGIPGEFQSLLPEEVNVPIPEMSVFGPEDSAFMQSAAGSLTEPAPALVDSPFVISHVAPLPEPSEIQEESPFLMMDGADAANANAWDPHATLPAPAAQPGGPGALERLREMMDRLRSQPPATPPAVAGVEEGERMASAELGQASLLQHYENLKVQLAPEAEQRPLDMARVGEVVRLAGKRFPLVKFDELELPGFPGRTVPRWTLQDLEILFGLPEFSDRAAWRAFALVAEDRLADTSRPASLKLVALKSDRETLSWTALMGSDLFPSSLRPHVEVLHLDTRSIASLYAVQRMITEAATGGLSATPAQVMSVLARELDFFWKRVTRPVLGV